MRMRLLGTVISSIGLLERGIQPMVTLHHFTNPLWWEDLGAFEKESNIILLDSILFENV